MEASIRRVVQVVDPQYLQAPAASLPAPPAEKPGHGVAE
ncbi:hypothetical protein HRbin09_00389 [bacterium HR09]|nr:hypothetical protein HRbin09_00389 [bacterium HR09]